MSRWVIKGNLDFLKKKWSKLWCEENVRNGRKKRTYRVIWYRYLEKKKIEAGLEKKF